MGREAKFKPSEYQVKTADRSGYSKEQVADVEVAVANDKKTGSLGTFSKVWTILSTAYAIVSVAIMLGKHIVDDRVMSTILFSVLAVYVCVFVVLVALSSSKPKKEAKESAKAFKSALKVFKAFVNVMFLAVSVVQMTALASSDMGFGKWIVFAVTLIVALCQLILKLTLFFAKLGMMAAKRKFKVSMSRFVDGEQKKNGVKDRLEERKYK